MTIKEIANIYDDNEQIVLLSGDVNRPNRHYTGRLCNTPDALLNSQIDFVSAMPESRRKNWNLNRYGWTEIWIDKEN